MQREEYIPTENDWVNEPYRMLCGSAIAEAGTYHKVIGKSGRTWLYEEGKAETIHVSAHPRELQPGYKGFQGYAGRTLTFKLVDGSELQLQAPWSSNSSDLYADTGVDIRDCHETFVVVGHGRKTIGQGYGRTVITDVIYKDDDWTNGRFNRGDKIAKEIANKLGKTVMLMSKSRGGSCCGPIKPDGKEV